MASRRPDIEAHRPYPGSVEDINGQIAIADQVFDDDELQELVDVLDAHADEFDALPAVFIRSPVDIDALRALNPSGVAMLSHSTQYGIFEWEAVDHSTNVVKDIYDTIYIAGDADPTGATGCWVRKRNSDEMEQRWTGLGTDLLGTMIAARQAGRMQPGVTFKLEAVTYTRSTDVHVALISNVFILGVEGTVIEQDAAGPIVNKPLVYFGSDSDQGGIENVVIAANDRIHNAAAVYGVSPHDPRLKNVRITGWDRGIHLLSSNTRALKNPILLDVVLNDPSPTRNGYPVQIEAYVGDIPVDGITIDGLDITGPGLPWYGVDTPGTADSCSIRHVQGGVVDRLKVRGGGELGLAVNLFTTGVTVINPDIQGCDADGIGLGNGQLAFTLDSDETWFIVGETINFEYGGSGTVGAIYEGELLITDVTYVGATQAPSVGTSVTGVTSAAPGTITAMRHGCQSIKVIGGTITGNGVDALDTGFVYAGIKLNMAENITMIGIDMSDSTGVQTRAIYSVSSPDHQYRDIKADGIATPYSGTGMGNLLSLDRRYPEAPVFLKGEQISITAGTFVVNPLYGVYRLAPESGTEDELISMGSSYDGHVIVLATHAVGRTITLTPSATLQLKDVAVMTNIYESVTVVYRQNVAKWVEIARSVTLDGVAFDPLSNSPQSGVAIAAAINDAPVLLPGAQVNIVTGSFVVEDHHGVCRLAPESGTDDELVSMGASYDGHMIVLATHAVDRTITLTPSATLQLKGAAVLTKIYDSVTVVYRENVAKWVEVARSLTLDGIPFDPLSNSPQSGVAIADAIAVAIQVAVDGLPSMIDPDIGSVLTLDEAGEITIDSPYPHIYRRVDTFGGAASGSLIKINGGFVGQMLTISSNNTARDVTVVDNNNIEIPASFTLDHNRDRMQLHCHLADFWAGVSTADNEIT